MDMFIDGRWMQAASGARHNVTNPATGAVIDTVPTGDARETQTLRSSLLSALSRHGGERRLRRAHACRRKLRT